MLLEMDDIAILIHQNPDGDALGSGYGLCLCLQQLGKNAKVLCSDEIPARYSFLLTAKEQDFTPVHYVSVDVADPKLLGSLEELAGKVELCIDHHITNKEYAAVTLCDGNAAAAAQIVFDVCKQMGAVITPDIANCFIAWLFPIPLKYLSSQPRKTLGKSLCAISFFKSLYALPVNSANSSALSVSG